MDCSKFEELCSAYLDGALPENELLDLLAHLEECERCAAYLDALKTIRKGLDALPCEMPEELHEKIMEKVVAEAASTTVQYRQPKHHIPVFTMVAAAAAAVVLVVSGTVGDLVNMTGSISAEPAGAALAGAPAPQSAMFAEPPAAAQGLEPGSSAEAAPDGAPAPMPRMAAMEPKQDEENDALQVESKMLPDKEKLPDFPQQLNEETFSFLLVARGDGDFPLLEATLISGGQETGIAYYKLKNNMTLLQNATTVLTDAGFTAELDTSSQFVQDPAAENGLIVIMSAKAHP